jgi:predicted  nucleic acid-binding Zn-ribbon protein
MQELQNQLIRASSDASASELKLQHLQTELGSVVESRDRAERQVQLLGEQPAKWEQQNQEAQRELGDLRQQLMQMPLADSRVRELEASTLAEGIRTLFATVQQIVSLTGTPSDHAAHLASGAGGAPRTEQEMLTSSGILLEEIRAYVDGFQSKWKAREMQWFTISGEFTQQLQMLQDQNAKLAAEAVTLREDKQALEGRAKQIEERYAGQASNLAKQSMSNEAELQSVVARLNESLSANSSLKAAFTKSVLVSFLFQSVCPFRGADCLLYWNVCVPQIRGREQAAAPNYYSAAICAENHQRGRRWRCGGAR